MTAEPAAPTEPPESARPAEPDALLAAAAPPSPGGPDGSPPGEASGSPGSAAYLPTDHSLPTRSRERATYDRATVHAILDGEYVCHLGFVRDGRPVVLPTLYARVGERLYVHGSTGSRPMRGAGAGLPVCLTVTHLDGLVLARSAFHHSINYRSVMVHGTAYQVEDPEERAVALDAIVEQAVPGRAEDSRRANAKELAATAVIRLDLLEVSAKVHTGGPDDEPEDLRLPHWSGVIPVTRQYEAPEPAGNLDPAIALPGYLAPDGPRGAR